jgi:hypothetical protein
VSWILILFALLYLLFSIYNDIAGYHAAAAAGRPGMINSALHRAGAHRRPHLPLLP